MSTRHGAATRRRRTALLVGLLSAFLLLCLPGSALASFSWTPLDQVDAITDGEYVEGMACASASQCTAVDDDGDEVTFNPAAPGTPARVMIGGVGGQLDGVACPSTTECVAVDAGGDEETFNPQAPGSATRVNVDNTTELSAVACPSTTQCTAVGGGDEVTFDPTSPASASKLSIQGGSYLLSVACPSLTQCTATDHGGAENTFNPTAPSANGYRQLGGGYVDSVACPSTATCTAVDTSGEELTFDPAAPSSAESTSRFDSGEALYSLACPAVSRCVAGDDNNAVWEGNPTATATASWSRDSVPGTSVIRAIACPTVSECVFVDQYGMESTGANSAPLLPAAPSSTGLAAPSGSTVQGDRLTARTAGWMGTPTSYTYQWERCDTRGQNCALIRGAGASSYTEAAADIGHRIIVQETARNAGGVSGVVSSAPTAVIRATPAGVTSLRSLRTSAGGAVVTVGCRGVGPAVCKLHLSIAAGVSDGAAASATVVVPAGRTRVVHLVLRAEVRRLLHSYGSLGGVLTITQQTPAGVRQVERRTLKFRA